MKRLDLAAPAAAALQHHGIGKEDADLARAAVPGDLLLRNIRQRGEQIVDGEQFRRIVGRDQSAETVGQVIHFVIEKAEQLAAQLKIMCARFKAVGIFAGLPTPKVNRVLWDDLAHRRIVVAQSIRHLQELIRGNRHLVARISAVEDAIRPGHDLKAAHLRMQEGSDERLFVVGAKVAPVIAGIILNRIGQKPQGLAAAGQHIFHTGIFQKGILEGAFLFQAIKDLWRACGAGPHLRNKAVAFGDVHEIRFRTDNVPVGIVDQTVRRHVAAKINSFGCCILFGVSKERLVGTEIKVLLQLGRFEPGLRRGGGILPRLAVIALPFLFEGIAIAG